jgi:hypothetical protein
MMFESSRLHLIQTNPVALWIGTSMLTDHAVHLNLGQEPFRFPLTTSDCTAAVNAPGVSHHDLPPVLRHARKCAGCSSLRSRTDHRESIFGTCWQCIECPKLSLCSLHYFRLSSYMHNDSHLFVALHEPVDTSTALKDIVPLFASASAAGKRPSSLF